VLWERPKTYSFSTPIGYSSETRSQINFLPPKYHTSFMVLKFETFRLHRQLLFDFISLCSFNNEKSFKYFTPCKQLQGSASKFHFVQFVPRERLGHKYFATQNFSTPARLSQSDMAPPFKSSRKPSSWLAPRHCIRFAHLCRGRDLNSHEVAPDRF
jgi:hypothetical protein